MLSLPLLLLLIALDILYITNTYIICLIYMILFKYAASIIIIITYIIYHNILYYCMLSPTSTALYIYRLFSFYILLLFSIFFTASIILFTPVSGVIGMNILFFNSPFFHSCIFLSNSTTKSQSFLWGAISYLSWAI